MGFHWWFWSAYISFWWQAVGFTIVWVLKIQLIEWLTIAHVIISYVLLFGFSAYVMIVENPKMYILGGDILDIINWIFIGGFGLMLLNIILSIFKKFLG